MDYCIGEDAKEVVFKEASNGECKFSLEIEFDGDTELDSDAYTFESAVLQSPDPNMPNKFEVISDGFLKVKTSDQSLSGSYEYTVYFVDSDGVRSNSNALIVKGKVNLQEAPCGESLLVEETLDEVELEEDEEADGNNLDDYTLKVGDKTAYALPDSLKELEATGILVSFENTEFEDCGCILFNEQEMSIEFGDIPENLFN